MPQICTVCSSSSREAIDRALVSGASARNIAVEHGLARSSVQRHYRRGHVADAIVAAEKARSAIHSMDLATRLQRQCELGDKIAEACARWLTDPEDSTRFDVGVRSSDVDVVYEELVDVDVWRSKRAKLSDLLKSIETESLRVNRTETKFTDPRSLVVSLLNAQTRQLDLLARLEGKIRESLTVNNYFLAPDRIELRSALVTALAPFPEARAAVAELLARLEAGGAV